MAIQVFSPEEVLEYIPEYGKNRESESPCVVRLHYVPFVKTQEYARLISARSKHETDKARLAEIYQDVQKRQFLDNIVSISGFTVDGKEITTPSALWEFSAAGLIYELIAVMESPIKIREGLRKEAQ
jgi:radical SAM superfamily enzyme with C-terminal helix-hairpin-helix motif